MKAGNEDDAYFRALAGEWLSVVQRDVVVVFWNANGDGEDDAGLALYEKQDVVTSKKIALSLFAFQREDGSVPRSRTSITCSGGNGLLVETTSLAVLLWLKHKEDMSILTNAGKAMEWLHKQCHGSFGSTQATVLALQAILSYEDAIGGSGAGCTITVAVDGSVDPDVEPVEVRPGSTEPVVVPIGAATLLKLGHGKHTVELRTSASSSSGSACMLPFYVNVHYNVLNPPSHPECSLRLETKIKETTVVEGECTDVEVTLENMLADRGLPMCVAIIGIPGGLEARTQKLDELKKSGACASYELLGKDVVLYFRQFTPHEKKTLHFDVAGAVPGKYHGPASRAYLYYTDEKKVWVPGMEVTVAAGHA